MMCMSVVTKPQTGHASSKTGTSGGDSVPNLPGFSSLIPLQFLEEKPTRNAIETDSSVDSETWVSDDCEWEAQQLLRTGFTA